MAEDTSLSNRLFGIPREIGDVIVDQVKNMLDNDPEVRTWRQWMDKVRASFAANAAHRQFAYFVVGQLIQKTAFDRERG